MYLQVKQLDFIINIKEDLFLKDGNQKRKE